MLFKYVVEIHVVSIFGRNSYVIFFATSSKQRVTVWSFSYIALATKWLRTLSIPSNDRIRNHLVAKPSSSVSASLEAKKIITKDNEFSPARIEFPSKWNLCA